MVVYTSQLSRLGYLIYITNLYNYFFNFFSLLIVNGHLWHIGICYYVTMYWAVAQYTIFVPPYSICWFVLL